MSRIIDAVTAVLVCDGELLVTRRQPFLAAFPGYSAFPGGKIDPADAEGPDPGERWKLVEGRIARALIRELREELALDLDDPETAADIRDIRDLGIALTPPPAAVRFNTRFLLVELGTRPAIKLDDHELAEAGWASPAEWLRRYGSGELLVPPPTLAVWRALADDPRVASVPDLHFENRERYELPVIEAVHGVRQVPVRSNTLPPATHTTCFLLGDLQTHRVLVDPSPADDAELDRLCGLAQRFGIHEIFLTHHHPDHHERSNRIARHFGVPMGMSEDTLQRIKVKCGADYFSGININTYREGDVLCRWLGHAVRVLEVPGHDQGQLALMPDNRAWCVVSDLIQGMGTVVIAKPEGHMGRYFASLKRVIGLDPAVILPSHGIAMGTTYRLRETLHHREQREKQVLALHREGRDLDAMLAAIYPDLDPRLQPLARMNIETHLDKLREDGVVAA